MEGGRGAFYVCILDVITVGSIRVVLKALYYLLSKYGEESPIEHALAAWSSTSLPR